MLPPPRVRGYPPLWPRRPSTLHSRACRPVRKPSCQFQLDYPAGRPVDFL